MTSEENRLEHDKLESVRSIAQSIGQHRSVPRESGPGNTCSNRLCAPSGIVFLNRADYCTHLAVVAVNDLAASRRNGRAAELEDQGATPEEIEQDVAYRLLTDFLDATPAGRSYAERMADRG